MFLLFVECHLMICLYIRVMVCARARFLTMLLNFRCPHCLVPIGESMRFSKDPTLLYCILTE